MAPKNNRQCELKTGPRLERKQLRSINAKIILPVEQHKPPFSSPSGVVFLVDDEKEFTDLMSSLLTDGLGVKTQAFNSPQEALAALETTQPRLIISDLMMPQMTGFEFLRAAEKLQPETPSILVTGSPPDRKTLDANRPRAFLGMLGKPISWRDIGTIMRKNSLLV